MTTDKQEQLRISGENDSNLLKKLGEKKEIAYIEIYRQATNEECRDAKKRLAKHLGQDKKNIEKPRQYYSVCDLKNLNTIAERLIDYLENHNLRIENGTQIQNIVKQIGQDWRSEGNVPKKINFD